VALWLVSRLLEIPRLTGTVRTWPIAAGFDSDDNCHNGDAKSTDLDHLQLTN
jgi:hypothetical protein